MIPKIIHYCWFSKTGKPIPSPNKKLIEGWKRNLPDYKFILWSEENFDINSVEWTRTAYEAGKYAFVTDYVRLYALYNYGGIYLDTDVELLKSFDPYLDRKFILGYEGVDIGTGTIGAEQHANWVLDGMKYYHDKKFIKND